MDKQQIISFIQQQLETGAITKSDLAELAGTSVGTSPRASSGEPVHKEASSRNLVSVFYVIGAIIVLVGVCILIAQNWNEIGFIGRIFVTLGISLAAYIVAFVMGTKEHNAISQVMFTISAALAPLGVYVLLSEANFDFTIEAQIGIGLILALIYGVAYFISKKNILVLITIGFASWAYYAFIFKIFDNMPGSEDLLKIAVMIWGATYICLAYAYQVYKAHTDDLDMMEVNLVKNVLYGAGTIAILGAGITIGGVFDVVMIALIFGAFNGSVFLKARSMLLVGGLFLMIHIIKLTSEYFADSLGWPLLLIISGFAVIGIGYLTFYLNKRFFTQIKA